MPDGAGASTGDYGGTDTDGDYDVVDCSAGCTRDQLIADDQNEWKVGLETELPAGRGVIAWDGTVYTISVIWQERTGDDGANTNRALSINVTLAECGAVDPDPGFACYRMEVRP